MKNTIMEEKITEFLKLIVYPVFAYLSLDVETTFLLIILMFIDSFLGAVKSFRLGRKIKRSIFWWGISTKLIFILIPVVLSIAGKPINYDFSIIVNVVMIVLVISEVYSILGNIYAIKNVVEIEKFDAVSLMIKKLRGKMLSKITTALNTIEETGGCKIEDKNKKEDE